MDFWRQLAPPTGPKDTFSISESFFGNKLNTEGCQLKAFKKIMTIIGTKSEVLKLTIVVRVL